MENPPQDIHHLFEALDRLMTEHPGRHRYTPLLLEDETAGDAAAVRLIESYKARLRASGKDETHAPLVPHILLDAKALASIRARAAADGGGDGDGAGEPEFLLALVKGVAGRFEKSMPEGSGRLRLPEFEICLHVMSTTAADSGFALAVRRRTLERKLYTYLMARIPLVGTLDELCTKLAAANWGFLGSLLEWAVPTRWWHAVRMRRSMRWVGRLVSQRNRDFLTEAVELCLDGAERHDEELMAKILLVALLNDLRGASRTSRLLAYRTRRRWPFVLLFAETDGPDGGLRDFLRLHLETAGSHPPAPLMVVGALADPVPDELTGEVHELKFQARDDLEARVHQLFDAASAPRSETGCVVLPPADAKGAKDAVRWLRYHPRVPARPPRALDWWKVAALALLPVLLAVASPVVGDLLFGGTCEKAKTGETVGVSDGLDGCRFGGSDDPELDEAMRLLGRGNRQVDLARPHKAVVYAAPLTSVEGGRERDPNALLALRGVLAAQSVINEQTNKQSMPIRVLVANTGQYFRYGAADPRDRSAPDVSKMIVDRAEKDDIVAVIGITQSRPESQAAVRAFDKAQIPTLATGVSGSRMVDGAPPRYFQLSTPNTRIAEVMVSFAEKSSQIRELTGGRKGAVVVYHPDDKYFSVDLKERLEEKLAEEGRKATSVVFDEKLTQRPTADVAYEVCTQVAQNGGPVFYAGRSSLVVDLFTALQKTAQCQRRERIPVIAETLAGRFLQEPAKLDEYGFLKVFDLAFNDPGNGTASAYKVFAARYRETFHQDPDPEAAGGYDALSIVSTAVNALIPQNVGGDFRSNDVYSWLAYGKLRDHLGATGVISLGTNDRYPKDKAVYIFESLGPTGGRVARLACGRLPDNTLATAWGEPKSPCP